MNLSDGRVETVIEGEPAQLDKFLADLQEEFKGYIENFNLEPIPVTSEYKDFNIKGILFTTPWYSNS